MDSGDETMGRYFEKKSGAIWLILTLLLFFYIFGAILEELIAAFIVVIVIGVIIWVAPIIRKRVSSR
jgi:ABC-type polysaccharide/polyol phosphate export permease